MKFDERPVTVYYYICPEHFQVAFLGSKQKKMLQILNVDVVEHNI